MRRAALFVTLAGLAAAALAAEPVTFGKDADGFESLFNGKDLTGWQGDPDHWTVEDGAITGTTSAEKKLSENKFLVWAGGKLKDFELKARFRLRNGNSGIYIRCLEREPGKGDALVGMQADFAEDPKWVGTIMEYLRRGILANRGEKVAIDEKGARKVEALGDPAELLKAYKPKEWNDYRILCRGGRVVLTINGVVMADLQDDDPKRLTEGVLGLQVHQGPPMKVQFKDLWLKRLD
ncbi:MAG TPA: DUF1080 domain-containing protein [Planctomycetota bacterium]|nr:DUF1080 domain-containing protein [Planctomycetota bacterium]HRR80656.1 DUF1080 domain-containing protein [Planctomycetota bacterium]HRT95015.1 DUF1080 domain-containing protein [Planctomycetota bacterium]